VTGCLIGKVFGESEGFDVAAKNTDDDFSTIAKKVVIQSVAVVADFVTVSVCLWLIYRCGESSKFVSALPDVSFALGGPASAAHMLVKDLSITFATVVIAQLVKIEMASRLK
jgi:uncharacterized membrane protein AbrB (regulator of aidB expression)